MRGLHAHGARRSDKPAVSPPDHLTVAHSAAHHPQGVSLRTGCSRGAAHWRGKPDAAMNDYPSATPTVMRAGPSTKIYSHGHRQMTGDRAAPSAGDAAEAAGSVRHGTVGTGRNRLGVAHHPSALRPPGEAVYFAAAARACLRLARENFTLSIVTAATTLSGWERSAAPPPAVAVRDGSSTTQDTSGALRKIRRGSAPARGSHTVICPPRCCGTQDTWPPGSAEPGGRTSATVQR
jgi:hypothetical protein